ncbi:short-subunit dehydrogenase [Nocardia tenerifensis]|uniref:Short-subunit dehydrogenase n=1 Tax=Nocardia tenerifensis TaxID=228006 RepID=A0A318KB39_9NOCA|nr:SDR family NAD(P)-dependent oxidoreductase [Nocardia tenerifensis]PXX71548.1 short-subunit dehydrogenase [Nocardia tenerifensis]
MTEPRKTCLVTGATSGIGEALTAALIERGFHVIAVGRNRERGEALRARFDSDAALEVVYADLSVLSEVADLAARCAENHPSLDGLVLNAGVVRPRRELTPDGFETDFAVNYVSGFLLTRLLRGPLTAAGHARVVVVSSSVHRQVKALDLVAMPTGEDFHYRKTYAATKLLNLLFVKELARRWSNTGISVNAADPGFVRTALGRDAPGLFGLFLRAARPIQSSPDTAARGIVPLVADAAIDGTGGYYANGKPAKASSKADDEGTAAELWDLTTDLLTDHGVLPGP